MKNRNNKRKTIKQNGRRVGGANGRGRRNYARSAFSKKAINNFTQPGKSVLKGLPEIKSGSRGDSGQDNQIGAAKQHSLKLVPKPKSDSANKAPLPSERLSNTASAHSDHDETGNGGGGIRWHSPRVTGLIAAILLLAMLGMAAWSSVSSARAGEESLEVRAGQTSTLKLAKEYIYAGSRMLAIEDYGLSTTPTATPTPPANANTATFVRTDTSTQGNWIGVYGGQGYQLAQDGASLPNWAQTSVSGQANYTWAASTTDARALKKTANNGDRVAGTWYKTGSPFTIDLNLTDGQAHQLALYNVDWDSCGPRSETLDVLDGATSSVLDTRSINSFYNGVYLVWQVKGHVTVRVTDNSPCNAVVSGFFIDDPSATVIPTPTPPTPTPTPPTPTPVPNNSSPTGYLESADGASATITGWSYDPDNPSVSNQVHLYVNGPAGSGTFLGAVNADVSRPDVDSVNGITGNHGFNFTIPSQYLDGQQHSVYAYGIDTGTNDPALLNSSPRYFQYPVPTPTPTPPTPTPTPTPTTCPATSITARHCEDDGGTWNTETCQCDMPERH